MRTSLLAFILICSGDRNLRGICSDSSVVSVLGNRDNLDLIIFLNTLNTLFISSLFL